MTEEFFRWDYKDLENLSEGSYFAILETLYSENVRDRFILNFEITGLDEDGLIFILQSEYVLYPLLLIIILITSFVIIDFLYSKDNRDIGEFKNLNSYYFFAAGAALAAAGAAALTAGAALAAAGLGRMTAG